jgi:hypothetical protein
MLEVKGVAKDNYRRCKVNTRYEPDELGNDIHLYINNHFYHGHSDMTITHLKLIHKVLGKFLKKYKE